MSVKKNLDAIVRQWAHEQLEVTEQAKSESSGFDASDVDDQKDVYGDLLEEAHEDFVTNRQRIVRGLANELVAKHGRSLVQWSPEYQRLSRDLLRARVDVLKEELRRMEGEYSHSFVSDTRQRRQDEAESQTATPASVKGVVCPSIAETFTTYQKIHDYRRGQRVIEATLHRFLKHARLSGGDPVSSMTKSAIAAWMDHESTGVSATTVAKRLTLLGHYLRWLVKRDHLPTNPAAGLEVPIRAQRASKLKKKDFSPAQMRMIVDALIERKRMPTTKYLGEYFWVSQVVLFTGVRSAEAWDLWSDRILVDDGVTYFDLQKSKERDVNLKTATSARRVPIHSGLIALGFDYVRARRKTATKSQEAVKLFPNINNSSPVSRFFMQTLRGVGITDRALTLHSRRRYWETALTEPGVQMELRHYITRHALPGTVGNMEYLHMKWPVKVLEEPMEKVKF